jgi:hypothetical protein
VFYPPNCLGTIGDASMRYYFHLRIAGTLSPDEIGLELPDVETAYLQAFETAQAMWVELLAQRCDPLTRAFEIADEDGQVLLTLPFAEVLERARKPGRSQRGEAAPRPYGGNLCRGDP